MIERDRLVLRREVRDAAHRRVDHRAAERVRVDLLVRHRLDDVGAGDEHVARPVHHDREVRHDRRVHGAARAWTHDHGDLRDDPGRQDVAREDPRVARERRHALLDARAAGVVEADDRCAHLHRQVHDLADLLRVRLGERSAEDREVLAEEEDEPAVDRAVAGDDAVAEEVLVAQPELVRPVRDEGVELDEAPGVEQEVDALPRRELPPGVLPLDADGSPTLERLGAHPLQALDAFDIRRHVRVLVLRWRSPPMSLRTDSGGHGPGRAAPIIGMRRDAEARPVRIRAADTMADAGSRPASPDPPHGAGRSGRGVAGRTARGDHGARTAVAGRRSGRPTAGHGVLPAPRARSHACGISTVLFTNRPGCGKLAADRAPIATQHAWSSRTGARIACGTMARLRRAGRRGGLEQARWCPGGACDRDRQPEGWRRQDDDGDQPGRRARPSWGSVCSAWTWTRRRISRSASA